MHTDGERERERQRETERDREGQRERQTGRERETDRQREESGVYRPAQGGPGLLEHLERRPARVHAA